MTNNNTSKVLLSLIFLVALFVFSAVSLVNHYLFRTYSLDLGAYTKCLYDFMHGVVNDSLVFRSEPVNCFANHFDLYLLLFSPSYLIFGTYALLIIQIAAILLGGYGMYKLIGLYSDNKNIPICAIVAFYSFFGIYHATTFDYHSNVVATMILPWFFYTFKKEKYVTSTFLLLVFIIARENMSLLMVFICIGLIYDYRKDRKAIAILSLYALFSIIYFYIITSVVMPYLSQSDNMRGFIRFKQWGNNFSEMIAYFVTHPIDFFACLFDSKQKIEFWICLLFSGGFFLLLKPNYLFMTVPLVAAKMLSNDPALWGIFLHYNVEFAPIATTACFIILTKIKSHYKACISLFILTLSISSLIYTTRFSHNWHNRDKSQIFSKKHYVQPKFNIKDAYSYIEQIPKEDSVCASDIFVPHLCLRKDIFTYHDKKLYDTKWMLLYEPKEEIQSLLNDYDVFEHSDNLWLLQKRK